MAVIVAGSRVVGSEAERRLWPFEFTTCLFAITTLAAAWSISNSMDTVWVASTQQLDVRRHIKSSAASKLVNTKNLQSGSRDRA